DVPPDVLVVAVPDREARVLAQPGHGLPRLGLDLAPQRFVLGVRRTREQEVLPDQDSGLVARVVEVLALVDPTAPDAQQVHPGVDRVPDAGPVGLRGQPGEERVVRNPVRTTDVDRLAVHREYELRPVVVRSNVQRDGPESDPALPVVVVVEYDGDVVQWLFAVT